MSHNARHGKTGLLTRMYAATTKTDVDTLLHQGALYAWASPKTRRRWARVAERIKARLA